MAADLGWASACAVMVGVAAAAAVAEVWNGKSLTATGPIAWPKGATSPWVETVSCATARDCLAVGYIDRNPQANGANTGRAAAAAWNGRNWHLVG